MLSLRVILIIFHLILKLHFSSRLKQSNCEEYLSQEELKFLEDELIQKNKKNNNTELEVILSDCRNGVVFQVLNLIKDNAKNFDAVHCFCKPKDNPTIQLKCMRNGNFITGFELIKLEQKIRNKFKSITPHKLEAHRSLISLKTETKISPIVDGDNNKDVMISTRFLRTIWVGLGVIFLSMVFFCLIQNAINGANSSRGEMNKLKDAIAREVTDRVVRKTKQKFIQS